MKIKSFFIITLMAFGLLSATELLAQKQLRLDAYDFSFTVPSSTKITEHSKDQIIGETDDMIFSVEYSPINEDFLEFTQRAAFESGIIISKSNSIMDIKGFKGVRLDGQIKDEDCTFLMLDDGKNKFTFTIYWVLDKGYDQAMMIYNSIK